VSSRGDARGLVARRSAVKAKTQAINQVRTLLVCARQDIRERLWEGKPSDCIDGCARLRSLGKTPLLQCLETTLRMVAMTLAEGAQGA
jgi:transposase